MEHKRWFVMQIWQRRKAFNKEIGNLILAIAFDSRVFQYAKIIIYGKNDKEADWKWRFGFVLSLFFLKKIFFWSLLLDFMQS